MPSAGIELSRRFYADVVGPLLLWRWPGLAHAAARIGSGSDVLGLDDDISRDHDWGLRLTIVVPPELRRPVREFLDDQLPQTYAGLPVAFAFSGSDEIRHRVEVDSPSGLAISRLGVWYPDDLWRYVVACDWQRLDEELPLMSRAGGRGDDLGSRVVAARLVDVAMHLGFMLERRWPPYAKWRGTIFARLTHACAAIPHLAATLDAATWRERQSHLASALDVLASVQAAAGLPTVDAATVPFWDRPYRRVAPGLIDSILAEITDERVLTLPRGLRSIEQRSANVTLLLDAHHRRAHIPATTH